MYGAGNPQMAALGALGALGGTLRELAMAPVRRWGQSSISHKVIAAGAGAGLAYYLHTRGMADVAVAVVGLGGAYATSALMHSRQVVPAVNGSALSSAPVAGALPPGQVQNMAEQAAAVMGNGNGSNGMSGSKWGSLASAAPPAAPVGAPPAPQKQQVVGAAPAVVGAPKASGGGKWDILG